MPNDCIACEEPIRQRWNYEHCSPTCVLAGELGINIALFELRGDV